MFFESWSQYKFEEILGERYFFVQDCHSHNNKGTLRGMHFQIKPYEQGKIIRCISGEIYDVIVDLRKSSPTFASWGYAILNSKNLNQIWIPPGFAHGFMAMSENSNVIYKMTERWSKECERYLRWDDDEINIKWPILNMNLILSDKDSNAPFLRDIQRKDLPK